MHLPLTCFESSNSWHGIWAHVDFDSTWKLIKIEHISTFKSNSKHKYEACVEAKLMF